MLKRDFEEFLTKIEDEKKIESKIDWESKKNDWLSFLDILYKKFEESLKEYIDKGIIRIEYDEVQLEEEYIGPYIANAMDIHIGGEHIRLKPIGTNLIGAKGRVDMVGRVGSIMLVLVDARSKSVGDRIKISVHVDEVPPRKEEAKESIPITWEWKFVTAPPTRKYLPVNQETIYSTIMEITNGQ